MGKFTLLIFTGLLLTVVLSYCSKPSAPDLDSPYDDQSENYISTPDLSTAPMQDVQALEARSGGSFENDYGKPVTQKGVCWSTSENPTIEDSCTDDGDGLSSFESYITELEIETTYYVRAYAINEEYGTIYGGQREFTTLDGRPRVRTIEPFDIQQTSARSGGELLDDGIAVISDKGLCYLIGSGIPGFNNSCLSSGSGSGDFEILIEDLTQGQIYSVRAYATNAVGTGWGEVFELIAFDTEIVDVTNPGTGRTWMDRNLGASRAATSSTDAQAYGDLYQWGRAADGHQSRNSLTTTILSNTDQPGHGDFILAPDNPNDWRSPQNNNLWQGVNGINNPCPEGYRLPTEAEWEAERQSWSSNDNSGAYASPLKLPMAGRRSASSGSLIAVGFNGFYWSGSVSGSDARGLVFNSSTAGMSSYSKAIGHSIRCIKD